MFNNPMKMFTYIDTMEHFYANANNISTFCEIFTTDSLTYNLF